MEGCSCSMLFSGFEWILMMPFPHSENVVIPVLLDLTLLLNTVDHTALTCQPQH